MSRAPNVWFIAQVNSSPKEARLMKTIIHDLGKQIAPLREQSGKDAVFLDADNRYAPCLGCYSCWLKNPGYCIMKDSLQHIGALFGQSDPLIIISRCDYGGYSSPIKAIVDRSISNSLPFFTWRGGSMHHVSRYSPRQKMLVCFYGDCTDFEKETARQMVEQNRLNLGYDKAEVLFFEDINQLLKEGLL